MDTNENGIQDEDEPGVNNATLLFMPTGHLTGTDANGNYTIGLPVGEHVVSVIDGVEEGGAVSPVSRLVQLPSMGYLADSVDFVVIPPPPPPPDLYISHFWNPAPPRPGFYHFLRFMIRADNYTGPIEATIGIDPLIVVEGSSFPLPPIIENTITVSELPLDQILSILFYLPPSVPLGTVLTYTLSVNVPENDLNPLNNSRTVVQTVVGSYDPNDKQVFPRHLTPEEAAADTVLEYLIRFQNTGTYLAERVVITDTLSTDLQWNTFRFLESSHTCEWYVSEGVAHFVFNDIMLPDSNANEPESHGYVRFKIRPRVGMLAGESVTNIANIYFDFNEPVITDPCVLAVEIPTTVQADHEAHALTVYPVPTAHQLRIALPRGEYHGVVVAMDGREVHVLGRIQDQVPVDVSHLVPGHYLVRVTAEDGTTQVARFMKE
ncbi:MAG TPA: T9SS type A sorting domain-containing protein [Flavobacteriales bacterium]|nr:T9SS type A sorting domain-containing protein [Flavobacteriales bacterium]